jgi:DNA-binding response OmpR family regulator
MSDKKIILVVDDEEDLREAMKFQLQANGFDVITASDGIEALERLKEKTPDLILLDVNMPRMTGLEFCNHIKDENGELNPAVLIVSARANIEEAFKGLNIKGLIIKPFDLDELINKAKEIISQL